MNFVSFKLFEHSLVILLFLNSVLFLRFIKYKKVRDIKNRSSLEIKIQAYLLNN